MFESRVDPIFTFLGIVFLASFVLFLASSRTSAVKWALVVVVAWALTALVVAWAAGSGADFTWQDTSEGFLYPALLATAAGSLVGFVAGRATRP